MISPTRSAAVASLALALTGSCADPTSPDRDAPWVSLAASDGLVDASGPVVLTAVALDDVGVVGVQFWVGATLLATDATSPYTHSVAMTPDDNGVHSFTAIALDGAQNQAVSNAVTVAVAIPTLAMNDGFSDGVIDSTQWRIRGDTAIGLRVEESNSRLELFIPGTAGGGTFVATLESRCELTGDFDIEVGYSLLSWPANNGAILSLSMGVRHAQRYSSTAGPVLDEESYGASHNGSVAQMPTSDAAGILRVVRNSDRVYSYFLQGSDWILIQESPDFPPERDVVALSIWGSDGTWGGADVRVALDDFRIIQGVPANCER